MKFSLISLLKSTGTKIQAIMMVWLMDSDDYDDDDDRQDEIMIDKMR